MGKTQASANKLGKKPSKRKMNHRKEPRVFKFDSELTARLEQRIRSIRSVEDAHVDLNERGDVYSIGVFTDATRTVKRIVREVEQAYFQITRTKIDYRKIGVVERKVEEPLPPRRRVQLLSAYTVQGDDQAVEALVTYQWDGETRTVTAEAHPADMELEYLIAHATSKAMTEVTGDSLRVEAVKKAEMGTVEVICVTLTLMERESGRIYPLVGSVVASKDLIGSVAKATLDAMNRKII